MPSFDRVFHCRFIDCCGVAAMIKIPAQIVVATCKPNLHKSALTVPNLPVSAAAKERSRIHRSSPLSMAASVSCAALQQELCRVGRAMLFRQSPHNRPWCNAQIADVRRRTTSASLGTSFFNLSVATENALALQTSFAYRSPTGRSGP